LLCEMGDFRVAKVGVAVTQMRPGGAYSAAGASKGAQAGRGRLFRCFRVCTGGDEGHRAGLGAKCKRPNSAEQRELKLEVNTIWVQAICVRVWLS
jgi:hypothetical protein